MIFLRLVTAYGLAVRIAAFAETTARRILRSSRRCARDQSDSPVCRGSCNTMSPSNLAYLPADRSAPVLETTVGSILCDAAAQAPDLTAAVAWGIVPGQRNAWTYSELLRGAE